MGPAGGAIPIDLKRIRPDFLVAAAYKWLLGPNSIGFTYVDPRWHNGQPIENSWFTRAGSEDFAALVHYRDDFQPGARRYDVGEPSNFALLPPACAALRQIMDWGIDNIGETIGTMTTELARRAERLGFTSVPRERRAPHYLGLKLDGGLPPGLGERLAAEQVYVSTRGTALRITPHIYNDAVDLDRFESALARELGSRG